MQTSDTEDLIACHDCDCLHRWRALPRGEKALCARCGALLYRGGGAGIETALALTLASLICLLLANVFPLLTFSMQGRVQEATLLTGVLELYRQDYTLLAGLVLLVSVVMPALKLTAHLYLLLPIQWGWPPWQHRRAFRLVEALAPWAMTEVYLLGVLVAFVKLGDIASIAMDVAFFTFAAHIVLSASASSALDGHALWRRIERVAG